MVHSESNEIRQNFRSSDNQLSIKFWLPSFSPMRIINPKVTVQNKIREVIMDNQSPTPLFVFKNRVFINRLFTTIIKINLNL